MLLVIPFVLLQELLEFLVEAGHRCLFPILLLGSQVLLRTLLGKWLVLLFLGVFLEGVVVRSGPSVGLEMNHFSQVIGVLSRVSYIYFCNRLARRLIGTVFIVAVEGAISQLGKYLSLESCGMWGFYWETRWIAFEWFSNCDCTCWSGKIIGTSLSSRSLLTICCWEIACFLEEEVFCFF